MNQIGVKFLLTGGQWLLVSRAGPEAKALFAAYNAAKASGKLALLQGISDLTGERVEWLVWSDQIVALHTFDPTQVQPQVAPPQAGPWGGRGSGLN